MSRHILVIEDNRDLAHLLELHLRDLSYHVDLAFEGDKGLSMAESRPYDLIILDMHMPDVNGLELAKMIRQCGKHADTPIIFLSADTDPDIQDEAMMVGADEYIQKPLKPEGIL